MALMGALVQGGLSAIGSLFGGASASRAAKKQMHYQDTLNENDARRQLGLLQSQNFETWRINEYIRNYNDNVLANHSTNTEERTERTTSTGSIDFQRLIQDAEAAGFNPITVLRHGGLAGYSTQNTDFYSHTSGKQARDVMTFLAPPDVPHMGYNGQVQTIQPTNPIGDGINAALQYWNNFDPTKEQRRQLEMGLTRAQIENLNSETRRNMLMQVPSYTGGGRSTSGGFSGFVNSVFGNHPQADMPEVGNRTATNNYPYGSGLMVNPAVPDYEMTETRLGENPFTWPFSLYILGSDIDYTMQQKGWNVPGVLQSGPNQLGQAARGWLEQQYNTMLDSWNNSSTRQLVTGAKDNFPWRLETTRP